MTTQVLIVAPFLAGVVFAVLGEGMLIVQLHGSREHHPNTTRWDRIREHVTVVAWLRLSLLAFVAGTGSVILWNGLNDLLTAAVQFLPL